MTITTPANTLREFDIFSRVSESTFNALTRMSSTLAFHAGETIVQAEKSWPGLIIVLQGQLKAFRTNKSGKEQVFEVAERGSLLGVSGIVRRPVSPLQRSGSQGRRRAGSAFR